MHKIALIDANAIAFRSLFSHESLTVEIQEKIVFTGMAYGFLQTLVGIAKDFSPDKIVVFWDGGSARKKKIFPGYKAGRKTIAKRMSYEDIKSSLQMCAKLVKLLGIEQYRVIGEEGDDCIASYIAQNKGKFLIFSNDHDFFQLLSKNVKLVRMARGETIVWTKKMFKKDKGFSSKFYTHYLSIVGDSTDKIPGVKGVGEVATKAIFKQLRKPTLRNVLRELNDIEATDNVKAKIRKDKYLSKMFHSIIALKEDIELIPLEKPKLRTRSLGETLMALEFKSIYGNERDMEILCSLGL